MTPEERVEYNQHLDITKYEIHNIVRDFIDIKAKGKSISDKVFVKDFLKSDLKSVSSKLDVLVKSKYEDVKRRYFASPKHSDDYVHSDYLTSCEKHIERIFDSTLKTFPFIL